MVLLGINPIDSLRWAGNCWQKYEHNGKLLTSHLTPFDFLNLGNEEA